MTEDLKPCPFCGSEDLTMDYKDVSSHDIYTDFRYFVKCEVCGCRSKKCKSKDIATVRWNRRV